MHVHIVISKPVNFTYFLVICRYTKTVADSSLMAQRYNPEFTITTMSPTTTSYGNANTSVLIDQLRHINQVSPRSTVMCSSTQPWLTVFPIELSLVHILFSTCDFGLPDRRDALTLSIAGSTWLSTL